MVLHGSFVNDWSELWKLPDRPENKIELYKIQISRKALKLTLKAAKRADIRQLLTVQNVSESSKR